MLTWRMHLLRYINIAHKCKVITPIYMQKGGCSSNRIEAFANEANLIYCISISCYYAKSPPKWHWSKWMKITYAATTAPAGVNILNRFPYGKLYFISYTYLLNRRLAKPSIHHSASQKWRGPCVILYRVRWASSPHHRTSCRLCDAIDLGLNQNHFPCLNRVASIEM